MPKKLVSLFLAFCIFIVPCLLNAQEVGQAVGQAQMDAVVDVNGCLWMGGGFLFALFAIGAAYVIVPSPRAARLLGKSPEYVAAYTNTYIQKARSIQVTNSVIGCLGGVVLYVIVLTTIWTYE